MTARALMLVALCVAALYGCGRSARSGEPTRPTTVGGHGGAGGGGGAAVNLGGLSGITDFEELVIGEAPVLTDMDGLENVTRIGFLQLIAHGRPRPLELA